LTIIEDLFIKYESYHYTIVVGLLIIFF